MLGKWRYEWRGSGNDSNGDALKKGAHIYCDDEYIAFLGDSIKSARRLVHLHNLEIDGLYKILKIDPDRLEINMSTHDIHITQSISKMILYNDKNPSELVANVAKNMFGRLEKQESIENGESK